MKKYPQTTGYYVYCHITPDKMCYFGMSKQQPYKRWQPVLYKNISLEPYIEKYGWDSIEHMVIQDDLTKHQAEVIEDWFIKNATKDGFCINYRRSGGKRRDNPKEYQREYMREYNQHSYVKEYHREYNHEYYNTEKWKEYKREYHREYSKTEKRKEYQREWQRQYRLKKKQEKLLSDNVS